MLKITNCEVLHYAIVCSSLITPFLLAPNNLNTLFQYSINVYYIFKMQFIFKLNLNFKKCRSSHSVVQINRVFHGGRKSLQEKFAFWELVINSEKNYTLWFSIQLVTTRPEDVSKKPQCFSSIELSTFGKIISLLRRLLLCLFYHTDFPELSS
jgi:hypothetical protein